MPMPRHIRLIAALLAVLMLLGAVLPAVSQARRAEPDPAQIAYAPRFVTQTDQPTPWRDCMWASGAMLIDKLTEGAVRYADERELRYASGDLEGGSTFGDLARGAWSDAGVRILWSPHGGDPMTWTELLDRLASGGGAAVAGWWHELESRYAKKISVGHAVYVERYEPHNGRMWLMDPIGRGRYTGEWVSVENVHDFIWKSRAGYVYAAATPPLPVGPVPDRDGAQAPRPTRTSIDGYLPGALALDLAPRHVGDEISLTIPLAELGRRPLPQLIVDAQWERIASYEMAAIVADEPIDGVPTDVDLVDGAPDAPGTNPNWDEPIDADDLGAHPIEGEPAATPRATPAPSAPPAVVLLPPHGEVVEAVAAARPSPSAEPADEPAEPGDQADGDIAPTTDDQSEPAEEQLTRAASAPLVVVDRALSAKLAAPEQPGRWRLALTLRTLDGRPLPDSWQIAPVELDVWPSRGASAWLEFDLAVALDALTADQSLVVTALARNVGLAAWTDAGETSLELAWTDDAGVLVPAASAVLVAEPGENAIVPLLLGVPAVPGRYRLTLAVRDAEGSYLPHLALELRELVVVVDTPADE